MREFLQSPSQRNKPEPSLSILTPSTGIATNPNLLKQPLDTKSKLDNVSPSFLFVQIVCVCLTYPSSFLEMDNAKRRAAIRLQAAKNKEANVDPMRMGSSKPSTKRRLPSKGDRAPKKPKVSLEPVIGLMAEGAKTITSAKHKANKGLIITPPGS